MKALPRYDYIDVLSVDNRESQSILTVRCPDYEAWLSMPAAIEFRGSIYGRTGWDSDRCLAYFKTGTSLARPLVDKNTDEILEEFSAEMDKLKSLIEQAQKESNYKYSS